MHAAVYMVALHLLRSTAVLHNPGLKKPLRNEVGTPELKNNSRQILEKTTAIRI